MTRQERAALRAAKRELQGLRAHAQELARMDAAPPCERAKRARPSEMYCKSLDPTGQRKVCPACRAARRHELAAMSARQAVTRQRMRVARLMR